MELKMMNHNFKHKLEKINPLSEEYAIVITLADHLSEFANELGTLPRERRDVITIAKRIIREQYPTIKVTMVKVIIGGMAVSAIPLISDSLPSVEAAGTNSEPSQVSEAGSIYYHVSPGDTLWNLSTRFNTSINNIKRANNLSSDNLGLNQKIIIPKALHTVSTGEYLSVLAKKYGTTVSSMKEANGLSSDTIRIGQTLIIPVIIGAQTNGNEAEATSPTSVQAQGTKYTVVSGDTLYSIAKRFGVTVDALRSSNKLTSDILSIGQVLTINSGNTATPETPPTPAQTNYIVVSGDTLYSIAKRFEVTVDGLRGSNKLTSDILSIGQVLTIPIGNTVNPVPAPEPVQTRPTTYTVVPGDTLYSIAKRFGITVDVLRSTNRLASDILSVGQALTIPNGINAPIQTGNTITYTTHTVVSGDNIWDLSVRYGIPQAELLRANNLTTSSRLSIGQKLSIPVHNIAVKDVVSAKHGEYMDWWTEAQYVFPIGKTVKVTDFITGKSFYIKRTIGANHADSETVTGNDTNIAKSIWGGFSWTPRAVILDIDGRKIAASMSFMPHEQDFIANNGITGHFDVYFGNCTRHVDGKADPAHQAQVEKAAGLR
jgi:peptidoglycan DL-endopeptidase LytF